MVFSAIVLTNKVMTKIAEVAANVVQQMVNVSAENAVVETPTKLHVSKHQDFTRNTSALTSKLTSPTAENAVTNVWALHHARAVSAFVLRAKACVRLIASTSKVTKTIADNVVTVVQVLPPIAKAARALRRC